MSPETIAVGTPIAALLVTVSIASMRASAQVASRLAVLEIRVSDLREDLSQLRDAWLSLSATRARHSRETEVIDGYEIS